MPPRVKTWHGPCETPLGNRIEDPDASFLKTLSGLQAQCFLKVLAKTYDK
jgi:hypothetical protein